MQLSKRIHSSLSSGSSAQKACKSPLAISRSAVPVVREEEDGEEEEVDEFKKQTRAKEHFGHQLDETKLSKPIRKQLKQMKISELELILSSSDNFLPDCLLDSDPQLKKLQKERDNLERQVHELAQFNYAREPEFVRDRKKLREKVAEVGELRRKLNAKHFNPILDQLQLTQSHLSDQARQYEEKSERLAQDFLTGAQDYKCFVEQYINLRKDTSHKRLLADRLAKDKNRLAEHITKPFEPNSPVPTPRQRKRVSLCASAINAKETDTNNNSIR